MKKLYHVYHYSFFHRNILKNKIRITNDPLANVLSKVIIGKSLGGKMVLKAKALL